MSQAGLAGSSGGGTLLETLTGNSGGAVPPTANNINIIGTGGVTVAGDAGTSTLTISVAAEGLTWNTISSSQALSVNNGYFCVSPGGALSLSLPAVSSLGDVLIVYLDGATSFTITQGAGQSIRIGNLSTTAGVGGSIASTGQGDSITLVCRTANLKWNATSEMGNLIII